MTYYRKKETLTSLVQIYFSGKFPKPPQKLHVTCAFKKPVPLQCSQDTDRGEMKPNPLQSLHFTCSADKPVPLQRPHVTLSVFLLALSASFVMPFSLNCDMPVSLGRYSWPHRL